MGGLNNCCLATGNTLSFFPWHTMCILGDVVGVCGAIWVQRWCFKCEGARVSIVGVPDCALPSISSQLKKKLSSALG